MSTIDPSQLTAADMGNPALSAQDLADITAARPDLRPYVATHPSLYPALGQWLADQGVVPAQPPAAEEPVVEELTAVESEAPVEESGEQAEPFADAHEETQPVFEEAHVEAPAEHPAFEEAHVEAPAEQPAFEEAHVEAPAEQPAFEEAHVEAPAESEVAPVEPEAPVTEVAEAGEDNLEQAILEGAAQSEAPAGDEAAPAPSTEEQVAQSPFSNPPQAGAESQGQPQYGTAPQQGQQAPFGQPQYGAAPQQGQPQYGTAPQQGQQAPFGQPGQQQYGQPGYAPAGQSTGQQFEAAAQQLGAAANSALNQFQTAVVAETGKVSGRSVRATYSLIGIAASAVLILVSMLLPYYSGYGDSYSMFKWMSGYSVFHFLLLIAVVGLGAAYWFTNQKWAYLSAGVGALVVALLGFVQFIRALAHPYLDAGFGAFMLGLFSIALGVAGGLLLMELKNGAVAPIDNPNAFGGAFAGVQMGQQQGQFGQQQGGFQAPQAGQPQFGQQQGGFQAPQGGQGQYGQQPQFGQQQGQQPQQGDKPYNPFGPQA